MAPTLLQLVRFLKMRKGQLGPAATSKVGPRSKVVASFVGSEILDI